MATRISRWLLVTAALFATSTATADEAWRKDFLATLEKGPARLEVGAFDLSLHARINLWGGWVADDSLLDQGDPMQKSGFRLRRTRFGVDGHILKTVTYEVEMDIFDSEKQGGPLYSAWIDWTPSRWFGLKMGLQKFPFVRTEMNSSAGTAHLDRAIGVKAMAPGETLGLTVHSQLWKDHLTLTLGLFNGIQRKASFFQGYEGTGVTLGNRFERLAYVGRVDIEPLAPLGRGEPDLDGGSIRLGVGGSGMYSDGKTDKIYGASGYVHLKAYGLHFLGEATWDHAQPQDRPTTTATTPTEIDRLTAQGTVGYVAKAVNTGLAVRGEYINDNLALSNEGDQVVVAVSLTYYALEHFLKATFEYQTRIELHGMKLKNDAAIVGVQLGF
jgi:hypothetical protein